MNLPYMQFYPRDWMGEQGLQRLGYAERGLWLEMLCLMATGDEYGKLTNGGKPLTVSELARMTRGDKQEVEHLLEHLLEQKVYSRDEKGVIYSRRMVKEAYIREVRQQAGKSRWHQNRTTSETRDQRPDARDHSLHEHLHEHLLEQKCQQMGILTTQVGKWAPDVYAVITARPEFDRLIPETLAQIIKTAADGNPEQWRKNLDEFVADAANSPEVKNPTGMLRKYLTRVVSKPTALPANIRMEWRDTNRGNWMGKDWVPPEGYDKSIYKLQERNLHRL